MGNQKAPGSRIAFKGLIMELGNFSVNSWLKAVLT
jgi:hypothetical protein